METIAERLKALSDPTRLRIVRLLCHGELCVCDLMEALLLPQSKISRHMSFLKNSGWVVGKRCGKWIHYCLAEPDEPLQAKVLRLLCRELPANPQAREDMLRLRNYLKTKQPDQCD